MDWQNYFNQRYPRWLDFSRYQCKINNLPGQEVDLLNSVLLQLINGPKDLQALTDQHKDGYRGIDFVILSALKMNARSVTSPFRYRSNQFLKRKQPISDRLHSLPYSDNSKEFEIKFGVLYEQLRYGKLPGLNGLEIHLFRAYWFENKTIAAITKNNRIRRKALNRAIKKVRSRYLPQYQELMTE